MKSMVFLKCLKRNHVTRSRSTTVICVGGLLLLTSSLSAQIGVGSSPDKASGINRQGAKGNAVMEQKIAVHIRNKTISEALTALSRVSRVPIIFSPAKLPADVRVSLDYTSISLKDAINEVTKHFPAHVELLKDGRIAVGVKAVQDSSVRGSTVSGRITDSATAEPVGGVTVIVSGMDHLHSTTDDRGRFSISNVPVGKRNLIVRRFGYRAVTHSISVERNNSAVDVKIVPVSTQLSSVVTTVSGTHDRMSLGHDMTVLKVDEEMKKAPIRNVTELLETRVPGMNSLRSSGLPGAPTRRTIRGTNSILNSNDPIVVIDGARIYSDQSASRNQQGNQQSSYSLQSVLDQLDINSIEKVEVLKGPSASASYGADAANGVILITTKKGRDGPARVNVVVSQGTSFYPKKWPKTNLVWITRPGEGASEVLSGTFNEFYTLDSITPYHPFNDSRLRAVASGQESRLSTTVSGGSQRVQYASTVSVNSELGATKLAREDARVFRSYNSNINPPGWMERPDRLFGWAFTNTVNLAMADNVSVALMTQFGKNTQRRTNDSGRRSPLTRFTEKYISPSMASAEFLQQPEKVTNEKSNFVATAGLQFRPWDVLPISVRAGFNSVLDANEIAKPLYVDCSVVQCVSYLANSWASSFTSGNNRSEDVTLGGTTSLQSFSWITLTGGFDYRHSKIRDAQITQNGKWVGQIRPPWNNFIVGNGSSSGVTSLSGLNNSSGGSTVGWFVEPRFNISSRFFVLPSLRIDNNGLSGSQAGLLAFPKMNFSWLTSDDPRFPWKERVEMLRLRGAFGIAGVQPNPTNSFRLYQPTTIEGSQYGWSNGLNLSSIGNTKLKPERGIETEWGGDIALFDSRVNVGATYYYKYRKDMIVPFQLSESINGGMMQYLNVGDVRNTGWELDGRIEAWESESTRMGFGFNYTRQKSKIIKLSNDNTLLPIVSSTDRAYIVGYPFNAKWVTAALAAYDLNGNGTVESHEILRDANKTYAGSEDPAYVVNIMPSVSILRGLLSFNMGINYTHDETQRLSSLSPYTGDFLGQVIRTSSGFNIQRVNTLRLNSASISADVTPWVGGIVGIRTANVSLQGSNLWINTNYRGADPNVNSVLGSLGRADAGVLPSPRKIDLRLSMGF